MLLLSMAFTWLVRLFEGAKHVKLEDIIDFFKKNQDYNACFYKI
jgi:hypothetical protein